MMLHPLPARLDTPAATGLADALGASIEAGLPVALDGAGVEVIGQACLQVLAGARRSARARNLAFSIADPSDALADGTALAGMGNILKRAS